MSNAESSIDDYYTNVIRQLDLKTEFIIKDLMERVNCISNLDIKTLYKLAKKYIFIQNLRTRFLGLITEELNASLKARNILRVCCFSSTYFILFIPTSSLVLFNISTFTNESLDMIFKSIHLRKLYPLKRYALLTDIRTPSNIKNSIREFYNYTDPYTRHICDVYTINNWKKEKQVNKMIYLFIEHLWFTNKTKKSNNTNAKAMWRDSTNKLTENYSNTNKKMYDIITSQTYPNIESITYNTMDIEYFTLSCYPNLKLLKFKDCKLSFNVDDILNETTLSSSKINELSICYTTNKNIYFWQSTKEELDELEELKPLKDFPRFILYLKNLTTLTLSGFGELIIPNELSTLPLKILILPNNNISGFPTCICDLIYLEYLDMQNNYLFSLPIEVNKLKNLRSLNINNCKISIIDKSLFSLPYLTFLNASRNKITSLEGIENATQLKELILDFVDIKKFPNVESLHKFMPKRIYDPKASI